MERPADDTTLSSVPSIVPSPRATAGPSAYLVVISGPSFGEMYKLKAERTVLGRGDRTDVRVLDDGVSREHSAIERDGGTLMLVDLRSTNGTFCNGERVQRYELKDGDKISIGATTILRFTYYQDQVDEHYQKQLFESALRDGLTATFNRRYFIDRLQSEIRFAVRHGKSLALLFADIDHFKKINDTHGHLAGDQVLMAVAGVMTAAIRAEDVLARYGGEEFAVICREIDVAGAKTLGERLRAAVAAHRFEHAGKVIPVTISVGAAVERKIDDVQTFIAAADAAMYDAKRSGRDRVCLNTGPKRAEP
jgi:two-component system cell cycle response regulator